MRLLNVETRHSNELAQTAKAGQLYAVIDACVSEEVLESLLQFTPVNARSLYEGEMLVEGWAVSPYLVRANETTLEWAQSKLWGESWGVLLSTTCSWDSLYDHLKKMLFVQDESESPLYFRFYDPRVLQMFLPTCTREQLVELYGPIDSFGLPTERAGEYSIVTTTVKPPQKPCNQCR